MIFLKTISALVNNNRTIMNGDNIIVTPVSNVYPMYNIDHK